MGQEWTVFQFVALSGFVMGCPRNIVNGQGLKVSTAKHSSEKGEGGSHPPFHTSVLSSVNF